ncbi:MAG: hypothetical protein IPK64_15905 [bacterium]|nr:hypothetical protein [bacterium]
MGLPSCRTLIRAIARRFGPLMALAAVCALGVTTVVPARATTIDGRPPARLRFSVQDPDGKFFPHGEVEFCLHGGGCLYADIDRGYPGQFSVPAAKLVPGGLYQVIVYDPDVDVVYETRDWRYVPADHDPGYDILLGVDKFLVFAQFRGLPGGGLAFEIANTLNPEWELRAGTALANAGPDSLPGFPKLVGRLTVPLMLGSRYGEDPAAAGGVLGVDPGLGLAMAWRSRYPRSLDATERRVPFHEFTLAWDGNRYETAQVLTPGRSSDVVFHRLTVAYGLGRASHTGESQYSLSAVLGAGAVLDRTEVLRYLGREYRMFGLGLRLVYAREVAASHGVRVGLCATAEIMHWRATPVGTDHWHGAAPAVALGLAFY